MSTLGVDGIISGLDTSSIVSALMEVEAQPQVLLENKKSDAEEVLEALQDLNTGTAAIATAAESAADPDNWTAYTATSSSDSVTVSTDATATAGTLTFTVSAVAAKQVSLTDAVTDGASLGLDDPPTLTLKNADGEYVTVTADSNSLADVAAAINDSDMGVTATLVQVTGGASPTYRLQFTSDTTGTEGAFELYVGDEAAVTAGTAARLDSTVVTDATDASITLYAGTAAETTFTQSSNTFSDLMTGVDVTLGDDVEAGDSVTITVDTNAEEVEGLASSLVDAINAVLADIKSYTSSTTEEDDDGNSVVSAGVLGLDSTTRNLKYALVQAASGAIDGQSPSQYGIVIEDDGTFTFDADVFAEALESDPDGTAAFMQALAARVQTAAEGYSDSKTGALTLKITSQENKIDDYADRISAWDDRLAKREEILYAKFTAMETALATLESQQSYIEQMIESLSTSSS
ncbi:flagellar filament capping protein FliD [Demequina sp. NBRC 110054]|uniref:flagellar filament capping protein FliD n=1 Tax=Demequina sp. NBRC 110054 TaxID=1570343 RepID=UPI0013564620|nr:flagellar filament capping protein FliD [Demequina sp. NBRC 110054]